jgi:alkylation response protein AidB-like acyl-CoA dehydrogenase
MTVEHEVLSAVRALAPTILDAAPRIEAERQLPDGLVAALTDAAVFQMYQPRSMGGPELDPLAAFAVCEDLARCDGSVGWCAQVSAAVTIHLAWIDPDALAEMQAMTDGPIHMAGSARPLGDAQRTEDGYVVTGHWNYASGVRHANWYLATAFVDNADGSRVARSVVVPVADGEIVANWDVVGMRGTGSDDFVLDDVSVPRGRTVARRWVERRSEPLYDPRLGMVAIWAPTAGVAIGLAQGSIDALLELRDLTSTGSPTPLGERANVQDAVAEAEAITSAARAFCHEAIGGAWSAIASAEPGSSVGAADHADRGADEDLDRMMARAQLSITHAMSEAVRVADLCFHAAGTNAISTGNRLERYLRDAHTAVQHAAGQSVHKRAVGRTLLAPDGP